MKYKKSQSLQGKQKIVLFAVEFLYFFHSTLTCIDEFSPPLSKNVRLPINLLVPD